MSAPGQVYIPKKDELNEAGGSGISKTYLTNNYSTTLQTNALIQSALNNPKYQGNFDPLIQYDKADLVPFNPSTAIIRNDTFYPTGYDPSADLTGPHNRMIGTFFRVDVIGSITKLRQWVGTPSNPGMYLRLYVQDIYNKNVAIPTYAGLLYEQEIPTASIIASSWNEITLPTPIKVYPNVVYCIAVTHYGGTYPSGWPAPFPQGKVWMTGLTTWAPITLGYDQQIVPFLAGPTGSTFSIYGSDIVLNYREYTQPTAGLYEAQDTPTLGIIPPNDSNWKRMLIGFDQPFEYIEYDHITTFTGPATTSSITIKLTRHGNRVTATFPSFPAPTATTSAIYTMTLPLPEKFRPASGSITSPFLVVNNNQWFGSGAIEVPSTGVVRVLGSTTSPNNFITGWYAGWQMGSVSWTV